MMMMTTMTRRAAAAAAVYGSILRRSSPIGVPLFPAPRMMRSTPSSIGSRPLSPFAALATTTPQKEASSSTPPPPRPPPRGGRFSGPHLVPFSILRSLPKSKIGWGAFAATAIFAMYGIHAFWSARGEFVPFTDVPYSLLPAPHLEHILGNEAMDMARAKWRRDDNSIACPRDPTDPEAARLKKIGSRLVAALEEHVWEGSDELRRARLRSEQLVKSTRWLLEVARTQRGIVPVDLDMDLALELVLELELELDRSKEAANKLAEPHRSFSRAKRSKALEGLWWDVLLVTHRHANAFSLYGGKTVVFTDMLPELKTDDELAFVIAQQAAHSICRHALVRTLACVFLHLAIGWIYEVFGNSFTTTVTLLYLPFTHRQNILADRVGLLITAKAGYDPRSAISAIQNLGPAWDTNERREERIHLLVRDTMDEALFLFEESKAR